MFWRRQHRYVTTGCWTSWQNILQQYNHCRCTGQRQPRQRIVLNLLPWKTVEIGNWHNFYTWAESKQSMQITLLEKGCQDRCFHRWFFGRTGQLWAFCHSNRLKWKPGDLYKTSCHSASRTVKRTLYTHFIINFLHQVWDIRMGLGQHIMSCVNSMFTTWAVVGCLNCSHSKQVVTLETRIHSFGKDLYLPAWIACLQWSGNTEQKSANFSNRCTRILFCQDHDKNKLHSERIIVPGFKISANLSISLICDLFVSIPQECNLVCFPNHAQSKLKKELAQTHLLAAWQDHRERTLSLD